MTGTIYMIVNMKNGKVYFGQTATSISTRWSKHKSAARRGRASRIAAAIRKHGENAFAICALLRDSCGKELDETEAWFIAFHEAANPKFGYNIAEGGLKINRMVGDANPSRKMSKTELAARGRAIAEGLARRQQQGLPVGTRVGQRHAHAYSFPVGNKFGCFEKSEEHRKKISDARKRYWERIKAG